jgi:hypothetical protein
MGRNWLDATKARCSRRLRAMLFAVRLARRAWACRTCAATLRLRAAVRAPGRCAALPFFAVTPDFPVLVFVDPEE